MCCCDIALDIGGTARLGYAALARCLNMYVFTALRSHTNSVSVYTHYAIYIYIYPYLEIEHAIARPSTRANTHTHTRTYTNTYMIRTAV